MLAASPFGHVISALVTPFNRDGSLDLESLQAHAVALVDAGHDGLVVSGTTGESPTTSDAEKNTVLRAVLEAVGNRARVIAGAGSNETAHTLELIRTAERAGADALLVVTPYYNKPPQAGLLAHFTAAAEATGLPVMLYDIPGRCGVPIESDTLRRLAEHPRILAVKDAKGDFFAAGQLIAETDLLWFSGDDASNLAHLAQGATGVVGVVTQVAPRHAAALVAAAGAGDLLAARAAHQAVLGLIDAIMNYNQGAITTKAALHQLGRIGSDHVRLPLVMATADQRARISHAITALVGEKADQL